ncbi:AAA-like domain-containing protein [Almyronema epifaneia]|uniref:AAA-like domain-containing protein n=1 Tax=Almyronema epifaneia S1 TaxID=2991925 RepID=A0ABW6IEI4_9CYAN
MFAQDALALLDQLLPVTLSNLQETVFCQVWEDKTYAEIADEYNYEHSYIRDIGFRLWQLLSEALREKVTKSNVKAVLSRYARSQTATAAQRTTVQSDLATKYASVESAALEFPNGPVPLNSRLYIERPPIEARTFAEVLKPGSLIRLKGPRQMGKTSLLRRILHHAKTHDIEVVPLSLHRVDQATLQDLDRFLRWFCANISYQLGIESKLDEYWNTDIGSKVSCTLYLEEYLLKQIQKPIAIALDEVNELFQFSQISAEFLPLLRSWYEDAKEIEEWRKVRWILSHATDIYVPLQIKQSPFNVGLSIPLPEFSIPQIQDLVERHGLRNLLGVNGINKLMPLLEVISCRPGLVRLALYHLSQQSADVDELIANGHTQSGIYSDHLRHLLAAIHPYQDLQSALLTVIASEGSVELPPMTAYRLESIGLIKLEGNMATISCRLYSKFFSQYLSA